MKNFWNKIKPTKRKIMQLYFALLFNCNIQGFFTGQIYSVNDASTTKKFCVPGINCYSCPGAVGACPLGSLQGSFSSKNHSTIYYVAGSLALFAILLGRMICGWLCPFGLIQELLFKIKSPKLKKSPVTRILSFLKYVILVFFVGIVPITYALRGDPLPAFCKFICPAGTIEGGLIMLSNKFNGGLFELLGPLFTWKFMLMVSIVVGSIFIFRLFCRFLCPLGALYGLFNKISFFGVKVDESKCTHCNLCIAHCHCDIKHVGDQECIGCGECIDVCPTKAISWKGSQIFVKANEIPADADPEAVAAAKNKQNRNRLITRIVAALVMLGVLIGAIAYYWDPSVDIFAEPTEATTIPEGEAPVVGNRVGNLCPSIDLQIITKDAITEETIDPATTGKVTIINFWGTWCSGCVAELPYFSQIASDYDGRVNVIAIHTNYIQNTAPGYIADNYADSKIIFASDVAKEGYYNTLMLQRDSYPYTVILDENGVIVFQTIKGMHYEDLQAVIDPLLAD